MLYVCFSACNIINHLMLCPISVFIGDTSSKNMYLQESRVLILLTLLVLLLPIFCLSSFMTLVLILSSFFVNLACGALSGGDMC